MANSNTPKSEMWTISKKKEKEFKIEFKWLYSPEGLLWLSTPDGYEWLSLTENMFLMTHPFKKWVSSDAGIQWLIVNNFSWLSSDEGYKYLSSMKGRHFLSTDIGHKFLSETTRGNVWLLTKHGYLWLRTRGGSEFIIKIWSQNDYFGEWFKSFDGYVWLNTTIGKTLQNYDEIYKYRNTKYDNIELNENIFDIDSLFFINNDNFDTSYNNSVRARIDLLPQSVYYEEFTDCGNRYTYKTQLDGQLELISSVKNIYFIFHEEHLQKHKYDHKPLIIYSTSNYSFAEQFDEVYRKHSTDEDYEEYISYYNNNNNNNNNIDDYEEYKQKHLHDIRIQNNLNEHIYIKHDENENFVQIQNPNYDSRIDHNRNYRIKNAYYRNEIDIQHLNLYEIYEKIIAILSIERHIIDMIKYTIDFKTGITIDAGGVKRQLYSDLFDYFFNTQGIELFNNENIGIEEISTVPIIYISIPSPNYYHTNVSKLGILAGYISDLSYSFIDSIGITLNFDKYIISKLMNSPDTVTFMDNYNTDFVDIVTFNEKLINPLNINYGTFPIISVIIQMITKYCKTNLEDAREKLNSLCHELRNTHDYNEQLTQAMQLALSNECDPTYEQSYDNASNDDTDGIPLNAILKFLVQLFELVIDDTFDDFIYYYDFYMTRNGIINKNDFLSTLLLDKYSTHKSLMDKILEITTGDGYNKLARILPNLKYHELRDLLKFWSGSSKLMDVEYTVQLSNDKKRLPTSSTCGYLLWIPNIKPKKLIEKIKIAINEPLSFGFV